MLARILPTHLLQHFTAAGLHRQMNVLHQVTAFGQYIDQRIVKIAWMRCHKPDARNIDLADIVHQMGKCIVNVGKVLAIRIDILPEQRHLFIALARQFSHLCNDVLRTTAALLAAGKRHDTICTELVASVHDVHPRPHAFPFLRQVLDDVAFLGPDFDHHLFAEQCLLYQMRQTVNIMRAKDQIHEPVFLKDALDHAFFL
ncbi:hypothetical protein D3C81_1197280 [compost metagenome]